MSKYQIVKSAFFAVISILLVLYFILSISVWWFVLPIIIFVAITTYGVLNIDFNYFFTSISKGETDTFQIALTFDDGPVLQTLEMLALLKREQIPATFFCIGKNIEENAEILKQIDAEKNLIGNHSYSHSKTFDLLSSEKMLEEILQTQKIIEAQIGKRAKFFRPPYGITNPPLAKAFAQSKLVSIGWSARAFDTTEKDENKIFKNICAQLSHGTIVLLHDRVPHTLRVTAKLINFCNANEIEIVPLDKLLHLDAYEI
ncbi:MAG TPA: polysaccharide deacetylase family protein [Chitinophagales bacterium]